MAKLKLGRLGRPKSTTGCKTCKIRKIKCDETRPTCKRCNSTGRQCDGYADPFRRCYSVSQPTIRTFGSATDSEIRYFEHFILQIVPGFTRNVEESFWHILIPQFSHLDQVVWDAVLAMSILVREVHSSGKAPLGKSNALVYYQKSLRRLRKQIERGNCWTTTCELTAIIYICIECLQQNSDCAKQIFLRTANAMQANSSRPSESLQVRTAVEKLLRHMAISQGAPNPLQALSPSDTPRLLCIARDNLHEIVFEAHRFVCRIQEIKISQPKDWLPSEDLVKSQTDLQERLQAWKATLPVPDLEIPSDRELHAVLMLVYLQYQIWLSTAASMFETVFDDFFEEFEAMICHAQIALSTVQPYSVFSFETRVLPSLFFVAIRCRDAHIRRRAISLLQTGPKMENTHDADKMTRIAQRIIGIEEGGYPDSAFLVNSLPQPPPECQRIHRLLNVTLPENDERYLDIGVWNQQGGNWCKFDYLVKL